MSIYARLFSLIALFVLSVASGFALEIQDVEKIRQVIDNYTNAWNRNKGVGFADGFVDDADFINIFGMHLKGKLEIEDRHVKILDTFLKNSTLEIQEVTLSERRPDVVIAHITWQVNNASPRVSPNGHFQGIFTHVFIRENNEWKIVASQNTLTPSDYADQSKQIN